MGASQLSLGQTTQDGFDEEQLVHGLTNLGAQTQRCVADQKLVARKGQHVRAELQVALAHCKTNRIRAPRSIQMQPVKAEIVECLIINPVVDTDYLNRV